MYKLLLPSLMLACLLALPLRPLLAATPFDRVQQPALASAGAERGLLLDLVTVPGRDRLLAVGEQGSILYSDDSGQSWQQGNSPVSVLLTAVQMVSATRGWAVGHDGVILRTDDGGESWQLQTQRQDLLRQQLASLEPVLQGQSDPVVREELQWQLDELQLSLEEGAMPTLLSLMFTDRQRGYVLGAYGALFRTEDGGESWQSLGHLLPNPDRLHLNAMLQGRNGRLLLAGEAGLLLYSDDRGLSWQPAASPYEGSFFELVESDRFYLLGLRGHLFSSIDGIDWQPERVPTQASLNAAVTQDGQLYLLGQGGVVLQRQGASFVPVQPLPRYSYTAGLLLGDRLLLAGEGGVRPIELSKLTQGGVR